MLKPHDIFNSEEQQSKLDKAISFADCATAFSGYFLTAFVVVYLFWQYILR